MSFLYARKTGEHLYILADTKVNYNENRDMLLHKLTESEIVLLDNYGIIKNVIVNKDLCIGSAGLIEHFNELLEYIEENDIKDVENIKGKALEINNKYDFQTDFIIAYVKDLERHLFLIKNNKIEETNSCWIGLHKCFETFQKTRNNEEFVKKYYDNDFSNDFNKMYIDKKCFENLIQSNISLDYVGKYCVNCSYTDKGFYYMGKSESYVPREHILESNRAVVNFFDTAENGGCTYITYCENNMFSIYYAQIKKKIIFEPYLKTKGYNHIRFPRIKDL